MKKSFFLIVACMLISHVRVGMSHAVEIIQVNNLTSHPVQTQAVQKLQEPQERFQPIFPLMQKMTISSHYGGRKDPFSGQWGRHQGIDFPAAIGTPILSTESGRVIQAGVVSGYGNMVEIDHGQGYTSKYAHASELLVGPGQTVKKGQVIAKVGSSGYSTGPHLHFEMAYLGQEFNPLAYLTEGFSLARQNTDPVSPTSKTYNIHPSSVTKIEKPFYSSGDLVASVRVRSGKPVKW